MRSASVCLGAALPYDKDPLPLFKNAIVAVCHKADGEPEGLPPGIRGKDNALVVVKKKEGLIEHYCNSTVACAPSKFSINPYVITLKEELYNYSDDGVDILTYPKIARIPMGLLEINLKKLARKGNKIKYRFRHLKSLVYIIELQFSKRSWIFPFTLSRDRERLLVEGHGLIGKGEEIPTKVADALLEEAVKALQFELTRLSIATSEVEVL